MPDAFGNIWPQYRRGWQQRYGNQSGPAGAQPFVGQPVTSADQAAADELEMISPAEYPAIRQTPPAPAQNPATAYDPTPYRRAIAEATGRNPEAFQWREDATGAGQVYPQRHNWAYGTPVSDDLFESGGGSGESTGTTGAVRYPKGYTYQAPVQTGYGGIGTEQGLRVPATPVRRATLVRAPGNIPGPDTPPNEVYDPNRPTQLPVAAVSAGIIPGQRVATPADHQVAAQQHAAAAQRHAIAAQQHTVAAQQPSAQVQFIQPAQQPGLAQRILQTLGHFFSGTLGQHSALRGQPVYQNTQPWTYGAPPSVPRAQPAYGGANLGFEIPGAENILPDDWAGADIAGINRPGAWNLTGYSGGRGQTVREWLDAHPPPKGKGGSQNPQSGQNPVIMGQPLGAGNQDYRNRPQYEPSELGQQDLSRLASSGTPEHMYNMGAFNPGLTNVGGGGASAAASEFSPASSLVSSLTGDLSKRGGGGYGAAGFDASTMPDDWAGADVAGMGGGGGGLSMGQLGGAASGILSSFGKLVQEANKPVSVNPAEWANAPPPPATFSWPMLQPNYGGVMYT